MSRITRLCGSLRKNKLEERLDDELQFHIEMRVQQFIAAGMTPAEARYRARRLFGNENLLKERTREMDTVRWIETLGQDLRYAYRILRRSPIFSAVAVLSLALGIGANTAIFSVMDALMLRTLPVRNPAELVLFGEGQASGVIDGFPDSAPELFSQPFFRSIQAKNEVFTDIAAMESMSDEVHARVAGAGGELEPVKIRLVSGNYFNMLGVGPSVGRVLTPEDDRRPGGNPIAVMSQTYWDRRFARDPNAVGRSVVFNGTVFTIVGAAAREFFGTVVGESPDLWIPLSMQAQVQPWLGEPRGALTQSLWLSGRLKPHVGLGAAQANANVVFQAWLHEAAGSSPSPERIRDMRKAAVKLTPAASGISSLRREFSRSLEILMVLVGLVLSMACANIANLLLARATRRRREIAVRMALGADRKRLIRQLLCESLALAFIGGVFGALLAVYGARFLLAMVSSGAGPLPLDVGPSGRVLLFTLGLSLLTGLIFGIAPAVRLTSSGTEPALKERLARSPMHNRLGRGLVAGQVALALFLMIGAGLFARTLQNLEGANVGFDKDRVLLLQLDVDSSASKGGALLDVLRRVEERVRALPRVEAASFAEMAFDEGVWMSLVWPQGVPHTEANAISMSGNRVGTQYFEVLGMPLIMGRGFDRQGTLKSPPVAVVNETFAHRIFPHDTPLGRHFALEDGADLEIIGVVEDAKFESVRRKPTGMFFVYNGQAQSLDGFNDLLVRTRGRPEALAADIRAAIHSEDSNLAISQTLTLREEVDRSLREEMVLARLASFFGLVAPLLASIGLYGIIAYSVAQRTNEIGIRMALGARPANLSGALMGESLVLVLAGFAAGLPAALACGQFVSSELYGVPAHDLVTFAGATATLLLVAIVAAFIPARRAALLDPVAALRQE
jgi:predicted permease